jgi:hypothetical protein
MRQGALQGLQQHKCRLEASNVRHKPCRVRSRLQSCTGSRVQLRPVAAAAAAEVHDAAGAKGRPRGRPARKVSPEEEIGEQGMPELPMVGCCLLDSVCSLLLLLCTAASILAVLPQRSCNHRVLLLQSEWLCCKSGSGCL